MMLKNIKQFVVTTITILFCKHEWEDYNWITNETCPPELAKLHLYDEPTHWHHINTGADKLYYYKCVKCGKLTCATGSQYKRHEKIFKNWAQ